MKKLLVLVLVLGVASLANAGLVWTYSGSTATQNVLTIGYDANPGDIITLALSSNSTTTAGVSIDVITDNGAAGVITNLTANELFTVGSAGMSVAGLDAMLVSYEMPVSGYAAGDWAMVSLAVGGNMVAANATIMTLTYTVGAGNGTVTINGIADSGTVGWEQNLNMLTMTSGNGALPQAQLFVPEPATIAVLGLGGLLLRRKK